MNPETLEPPPSSSAPTVAIPDSVSPPVGEISAQTSPDSGDPDPRTKASAKVLSRRSNGKIARLPKELRDRINRLLEDGVSYPAILEQLQNQSSPPLPYPISQMNISRWKDGGHQDWLLEQNWLVDTRLRQESASELTRDFDATQVNHAALQLGTLQLFEAMRDVAPGSLDKKLGGNSAAFARLINALARASRETILLQKYRETCAKARAALQALRDPNRKISESDRRSLVLMVDDLLGLPPDDASAAQPEGSAEISPGSKTPDAAP